MQNGGSSALDPILRELFERFGYHITAKGPEGTEDYFGATKKITEPLPEPFITGLTVGQKQRTYGIKTNKFIYLHRDPRDAAISWASDFHNQNLEFKLEP